MFTGRQMIHVYIGLVLILFLGRSSIAKISLPVSQLKVPIEIGSGFDIKSGNRGGETQSISPPAVRDRSFSKTKAVLLTLLAPGAGHFYIGEKGRGEVFLGAEAAAWVGFFAFRTYAGWRKDDYIRQAEEHAGIDPEGKDDDFYGQLSFYDSREDYNTAGRIYNPGDPYYPDTREYYWFWDSEASREKFRDIRNSSQATYRKASFMIGVAVLNRIVAAIDIYRLVRKRGGRSEYKKDESASLNFNFDAGPSGDNPAVSISISRRF
jgi:hypothetical protein